MLVGYFILNKKYSKNDFIASFIVVFGLINLYTSTGSSITDSNDIRGVLLMMVALLADSLCSNLQEKQLKSEEESGTELIFYTVNFLILKKAFNWINLFINFLYTISTIFRTIKILYI
jgi:drug/metabolite transporter (DMT)-like permease